MIMQATKPPQLDPALVEIINAYKSGHLNEKTLTDAINNCAESNAIAAVNHIKEYLIIGGIGLLVLAQLPPIQQVINQGVAATSSAVSSATQALTGNQNQSVPSKYNAMQIAKMMQSKGYRLRTSPGAVNIVYLQNPNILQTLDKWSDRRIIITFKDANTPVIIHDEDATTKPGAGNFARPANPAGSPMIVPGQYLNSWIIGQHCGQSGSCHEGLVQVGSVPLIRSLDGGKSFKPVRWELTGINQHWGYDMAEVRGASIGCLVGQSKSGHVQFMSIIKRDPDVIRNRGFRIPTTILNMGDLR